MDQNEKFKHSDDDWANRRLCDDGNCIGVIGPDHRCKECGKKLMNSDSLSFESDSAGDGDIAENSNNMKTKSPDISIVKDDEAEDSDWENRRLCRDGNCIGVIGPDGKCKECGKPYI